MTFARSSYTTVCARALFVTAAVVLAPVVGAADEAGAARVQFQKPGRSTAAAAPSSTLQFRSSTAAKTEVTKPAQATSDSTVQPATHQQVAKPLAQAPRPAEQQAVRQAPAQTTARPAFAQPTNSGDLASYRTADRVQNSRVVALDDSEPLFAAPKQRGGLLQAGFSEMCLGCSDPACGVSEPACGCDEPTCGICEPACGYEEPACGLEPECGLEASCACGEPDCGAVDCGSCVGLPGPDYWCFPVCLPRFKDLTVWGGVHGFKGPRDTLDGPSDNNFGFQEGLNLGGRAPLIGLVFPQLSYQAGYQAAQSQLSGDSAGSTEDRLQHFVTTGLFRRVPVGLQFGAVWDYMQDDLLVEENFQQVRYEMSIKSRSGLELGFWGATHTESTVVGLHEYQTVDQYCGFIRYHFRDAGEIRFWGGGTNDNEGIFGADAYVPFSNRWTLQTGFNYLIPEESPGSVAAGEESWNLGINMVWHFGKTAKKSLTNPHRPLFTTADNGTMFIDTRP